MKKGLSSDVVDLKSKSSFRLMKENFSWHFFLLEQIGSNHLDFRQKLLKFLFLHHFIKEKLVSVKKPLKLNNNKFISSMHSAPVLISTIYAQHSADVRGLRAEQLTLAAAWLNDSKIEKVNKSSIKWEFLFCLLQIFFPNCKNEKFKQKLIEE